MKTNSHDTETLAKDKQQDNQKQARTSEKESHQFGDWPVN